MDRKREAIRYFLIVGILVVLISMAFVFRGGFTGYAVFQNSGEGFDSGTYINTFYNGSDVGLDSGNLSGSFISQVFNSGSESIWNNISWEGGEPGIDYLFGVDGGGDVYRSPDFGVSWVMVKEDYGRTSDSQYVFSDSYYVYIISKSNREIWRSDDNGISWSVINDSFANSNLLIGEVDSSDNLFVVDASGDVYLSPDRGVSWNLQGDFNAGAKNNAKGIAINSSDGLYIVDGSGGIFSSVDLGINWIEVNESYGGGSGTDGMVSDGVNVYILFNKDIYQSTDGGGSWIKINDSFTHYSNAGLRMRRDSNNNFYIADGVGRIFKSVDFGVSWQEQGDFNGGASNNPKGLANFVQTTSLDFQVRSCDDNACTGESWIDIDDSSPQDLSLTNNIYFQYKVDFISPDSSISPFLTSGGVGYAVLNTVPTLSLIVPQDGVSYGDNESLALNFIVSDGEDNLDSCWYNLDGGTSIILPDCGNITFDVESDGDYVLNVFANDSFGEEVSSSARFSVQLGAPSIVLHSPIDIYLNFNTIEFNYTPTDIDLNECELWGDFNGEFELHQTDTEVVDGQMNNFNLELEEGSYLWGIKCDDEVGNSAFNGNKSFFIDMTVPGLTISEPVGLKISRTVNLVVPIEDDSPAYCWYNLYRGENLEISNTSVNCSLGGSFGVSVDADFVLNFYANDSAGNLNYSSSSFSVDTSTPVNPPANNAGIVGGGDSYNPPKKKENKFSGLLEVSEFGEIIARSGDRKTLSLDVKNTGKIFVNNCRLVMEGDLSPWVYSTQVEGIAPGENIDFVFDLNVPEEIESRNYSGMLKLNCDELNESQGFIVSIIPEWSAIKIKDIKHEKDTLEVSYIFNNSNSIGEEAEIIIWILDEEKNEVKKYSDNFIISSEELTERDILIELPEDLIGVYNVYFAISSDIDSFARQSVVLGKGLTTGETIFGEVDSRVWRYVIFVLVVAGGVFFILRRYKKKKRLRNSLKKIRKRKNSS